MLAVHGTKHPTTVLQQSASFRRGYNIQCSTATTSACAKPFLAFLFIITSPHYNFDSTVIIWWSIIAMKYELALQRNLRTTLNFPSFGPNQHTSANTVRTWHDSQHSAQTIYGHNLLYSIRMSTLHLSIPYSFQLHNCLQIYTKLSNNSVLLATTKYQWQSENQEQLPALPT